MDQKENTEPVTNIKEDYQLKVEPALAESEPIPLGPDTQAIIIQSIN